MTDGGGHMGYDTGLIALLVGIGGAILGWWGRGARDSERLETARMEISEIKLRLRSLENDAATTAATMATVGTSLQHITSQLARIEARMDREGGRG